MDVQRKEIKVRDVCDLNWEHLPGPPTLVTGTPVSGTSPERPRVGVYDVDVNGDVKEGGVVLVYLYYPTRRPTEY